jgi:hypothetical protein
MHAFVNDLRYAQTTEVAVRIRLLSGQELLKGVHEVNEEDGFVSLYDPQTLGDTTTTRKIPLDLIESLTVTDVIWRND